MISLLQLSNLRLLGGDGDQQNLSKSHIRALSACMNAARNAPVIDARGPLPRLVVELRWRRQHRVPARARKHCWERHLALVSCRHLQPRTLSARWSTQLTLDGIVPAKEHTSQATEISCSCQAAVPRVCHCKPLASEQTCSDCWCALRRTRCEYPAMTCTRASMHPSVATWRVFVLQ